MSEIEPRYHMETSPQKDDGPGGEGDPSTLVFYPRGLKGLLPLARERLAMRIDLEKETLARGNVEISFSDLQILEVRNGILGASDGARWICVDLLRYAGPTGPLQTYRGSFSPEFTRVLYELQQKIDSSRSASGTSADPAPRVFNFHYILRIDYASIILGCLGVGGFVAYEHYLLGQDIEVLSVDGMAWFLVLLGFSAVLLYLWRRFSAIRFDVSGITRRRFWWGRHYAWSDVESFRQQGVEMEFEGRNFRIPLNLEILRSAGSSLAVRRGIRLAWTPLGARFLHWIRSWSRERPEIPVLGTPAERMRARVWTIAMVGLNAAMYIESKRGLSGEPLEPEWLAFKRRLIDLGARTEDSFQEPWRFLTSLFLHGDALHFGLNMLVLAALAPWLGRIFGWWRGTAIYLGSGVLGNSFAQLYQATWENEGAAEAAISVGSSTAILGVIGSLLGAVYRRPYSIPLVARARFRWAIPVMVLLTLGIGVLAIPFIDNAAHLGGFLAGFTLVWLIPPRDPETGRASGQASKQE